MTSHAPRSAMGLGADLANAVFGHRTHVASPLWRTGRLQAAWGSYGGQHKRGELGGKRLADRGGVGGPEAFGQK